MLHPSHGVEREYAIGLERLLEPDQQRALEHGIEMEEGIARLFGLRRQTVTESRMLAGVIGGETKPVHWYHATLRQGMKRQLRRMFAAVGNPVRRLVRVRFGTLSLAGMTLGDVRELTTAELRQLEQLTRRRAAQREAGRGLIVSLDGPGGSGKSTVGARAATELEYRFCDTGVLYRGLTWLAVEHEVDLDDPAALARLVPQIELAPDDNQRYVRLLVDGREVTTELHTAAVDREVSRVSQHAPVREALLPVQRRLAAPGRLIMAGRDIGTVILPDADLKLFLEVSVEERARRRARERGLATDVRAQEQIEEDLRRRDSIDSSREAGPLRVPEGATIVHTEGNTLDETVADVVDVIRRAERNERLQ
jgi:cytidylate kinase